MSGREFYATKTAGPSKPFFQDHAQWASGIGLAIHQHAFDIEFVRRTYRRVDFDLVERGRSLTFRHVEILNAVRDALSTRPGFDRDSRRHEARIPRFREPLINELQLP